jgi:imidazolonepropionase-like amidohydrolase
MVPEIVRRAHAAGLRVMAHVETSADFHVAVTAGVDEIGHTPGFRGDEHAQLPTTSPYEITAADARLAAQRGTWVVTTLGGVQFLDPLGPDSLRRRAFDHLAARNLRVLRDAGVRIAVGSDEFRDDSVRETQYLLALGVLDPLSLLRLWSESTPRAIFPQRRVGCLEDGCEASLLVLRGDPSADFANTQRIALRMKDGRLMP